MYQRDLSITIQCDVDGDSKPDIVFTAGKSIYAIGGDGKDIPCFPIPTGFEFRESVSVADLDGDGKNELVAMEEVNTYVWKTNGNPNAIEWGSIRHDSQNTGEYGKICEPILILASTTWNRLDPCGNIIVQKGTLTIPSGKNLSLTDKTSKIIVRPGASLVIDGGTISNAYIWALPGSRVALKNGGKIQLRDRGKMKIERGATYSNQGGRIETIY